MAENEQMQEAESAPVEEAQEEKGLLEKIIDEGNLPK